MAEESNATVRIDGEGDPHPIAASETPAKETSAQAEETWRPKLSEVSDQLAELKAAQAAESEKLAQFQRETADQIAELKARPPSTPANSPPESEPKPVESKKTSDSEKPEPEKPASESSEKPAAAAAEPKYHTVLRRRRSI